MEVMKPNLIRIGKRCFRKNPLDQKYQIDNGNSNHDGDLQYSGSALADDMYCDEVCDAFTQIEETPSGFQTKLQIPSVLFKFLIGKKAETKRRLENETRTQIKIPRQGQEGPVVIVGRDKKGVISAKNRIDIIVESARQKQSFTHFLSFPIGGQQVRDRFLDFREDVLRFCDGDRGVESSLFQGVDKLHMTVGTLVLLSDEEIESAAQLLQQCQQDLVEPILKGTPLRAQVKGLEYMNDDPNSVDVLYAKIQLHDGSDRLQMLADRLVDKFSAAGVMQRDFDRVKLHITAMNTRFRQDRGSQQAPAPAGGPANQGPGNQGPGQGRANRDRVSFDAANILKNYGDHDFGAYVLDSVHLSIRHSTGEDKYYKPASVLSLPT